MQEKAREVALNNRVQQCSKEPLYGKPCKFTGVEQNNINENAGWLFVLEYNPFSKRIISFLNKKNIQKKNIEILYMFSLIIILTT